MSFPPCQIWVCVSIALAAIETDAREKSTTPVEIAGAIYLDAWQIEKEFIVSPLALQHWIDLGLDADSELGPRMREEMKPKIGEFLARKCPITIQDEEIDFTLDRIHFIEPDAAEFSLLDPDSIVLPTDIRVSVVFAAPNQDLRQAIQVFWNLIPEDAPLVPVKVADAGGTRSFNLTKFNPTLNVRGRYRANARTPPPPPPPATDSPGSGTHIPWLTIALTGCLVALLVRLFRKGNPRRGLVAAAILLTVGAAMSYRRVTFQLPRESQGSRLSAVESSLILDPLLRGIYHAFQFPDRSEQYDILGAVVGGDALTPIFLEIQRTLKSRERDGARVRVNDLTIQHSLPTPLPDRQGFEASCAWKVRGRVGHWGHFHDRTNLYQATFLVEPVNGTWKITGLALQTRERENAIEPAREPADSPANPAD